MTVTATLDSGTVDGGLDFIHEPIFTLPPRLSETTRALLDRRLQVVFWVSFALFAGSLVLLFIPAMTRRFDDNGSLLWLSLASVLPVITVIAHFWRDDLKKFRTRARRSTGRIVGKIAITVLCGFFSVALNSVLLIFFARLIARTVAQSTYPNA